MRRIARALVIAVVALAISSCASIAASFAQAEARDDAGVVESEANGVAMLERRPQPGTAAAVLVLLHPAELDKDSWTPFIAGLPRGALWVLAPDLGSGDAAAAELESMLRMLGVARVSLAGSGTGGALAVAYARKHPQQVASVALFEPRGASGVDDVTVIKPPALVVVGDHGPDASMVDVWRAALRGHAVVLLKDTKAPLAERARECAQLLASWWSREHINLGTAVVPSDGVVLDVGALVSPPTSPAPVDLAPAPH